MNREKPISLRLTAAEHRDWQAAAKLDGRSLANWIRVVVNACLREKV